MCNVWIHNEHGYSQAMALTVRATYDLLYLLTGDGTPRNWDGFHGGTSYKLRLIK